MEAVAVVTVRVLVVAADRASRPYGIRKSILLSSVPLRN